MKTGPRTHRTLGNQNKITLGHMKGMQTEGGVFKNLKTVLKPTKSQYDNSKNVSDSVPLPPRQTLPPASPLMSQALGKGRPSSLTDFQFSSVQFSSVHSGDQPWDFFGGNDAKAETPVHWPPHVKS